MTPKGALLPTDLCDHCEQPAHAALVLSGELHRTKPTTLFWCFTHYMRDQEPLNRVTNKLVLKKLENP